MDYNQDARMQRNVNQVNATNGTNCSIMEIFELSTAPPLFGLVLSMWEALRIKIGYYGYPVHVK